MSKYVSHYGDEGPEGWHLYTDGSVSSAGRSASGLAVCGIDGDDEMLTTIEGTCIDRMSIWANPEHGEPRVRKSVCERCSDVVALDLITDASFIEAVESYNVDEVRRLLAKHGIDTDHIDTAASLGALFG